MKKNIVLSKFKHVKNCKSMNDDFKYFIFLKIAAFWASGSGSGSNAYGLRNSAFLPIFPVWMYYRLQEGEFARKWAQ